MYKINLAAQVVEAIKDADQGKIISTDELLNVWIRGESNLHGKASAF